MAIFLTDQLTGRPNIKTMSREIMLAVTDFYKSPPRADGYREKTFTDWHRPAWDSGGFQFLMGKLKDPDPMKTVDLYKRIGVKEKDLPIQLDLPPRYDLSREERLALVYKSAEFYWRMVPHIPFVIPVVHGWTYEELSTSLELIDDPDKLASGAFIQSGRYVLDEAGNLKKGVGGNFSTGGYALDHVTSNKSHVSAGSYHATSVVGVGTFSPMLFPWSMGNLNPHSDIRDRIVASPYPSVIDAGIISPDKAATVSAARKSRIIASPLPSKPDLGRRDSILTNEGMRRKVIAAGSFQAEATSRAANRDKKKRRRVPISVIIERLATVLNMLRDRELFMLGGASPHMQHMIFLGGAKYTDTSAWRLKGYFGEIYLPEIGARSIGYKDTSKRLKDSEIPLLAECLRDSTHPLEGMPVNRFIEIGHMNMAEWKETWPKNQWEIKPFPLRALHNAWVLKMREEVTANEYANDPDRYHKYLTKRFEGRPQLTKRLKLLWSRLKRPWVQTTMGIYLKGGKKGMS